MWVASLLVMLMVAQLEHELAIRVDDQLIFPSENGKQFYVDASFLNDRSISDVM